MHKIIETVVLPELLRDVRLSPVAALTWVRLHWSSVDTLAGLRRRWPMGRERLRRGLRELLDTQWAFTVPSRRRRSPLYVSWMPPHVEEKVVHELRRVREEVGLRGEWLLQCILYIVVDDRDCRYNARPHWFTVGGGMGPLELDVWFRSRKVAVEFQGTQHYEFEPQLHASRREFVEQQIRDNVKAGLCLRHGLHYIEIPAYELGFEYVVGRVAHVLPLRPFPEESRVVRTLRDMCASYVGSVGRAALSQTDGWLTRPRPLDSAPASR